MADPLDDKALLEAWRTGDAEAGQSLFERHFDSVYGFFETKCAPDADELVQATFLAILRAKDQFRGDSSFRTYLFTIARHELYRVLRTRNNSSRINRTAPTVIAASAMLNAGKYQPPQWNCRKSTT